MLNKPLNKTVAAVILIAAAAIIFLWVFASFKEVLYQSPSFVSRIFSPAKKLVLMPEIAELKDIKKFASEAEFKEYLKKAQIGTFGDYGRGGRIDAMRELGAPSMALESKDLAAPAPLPERVSETNVQVMGIDEPDIVKTDGKEIYFSRQPIYFRGGPVEIMELPPAMPDGISREMIYPPYRPQEAKTNIIKAFPPADLALDSKIDKSGNLLLAGNILAIFSGQEIFGYDVSNPKSPQKKWEIKLEKNNSIVTSRLYKNKIYLVLQSAINETSPCPIKPLSLGAEAMTIACNEIYHPIFPIPTDITFIAMVFDSASGKIENKISFVGSAGSSVVYMSENYLYATYYYYESIIRFFTNFLKEIGADLLPAEIISKIDKLESYDIGQQAKMVEFQEILRKYYNSLDGDRRLKIENEMTNRMADYYKEHKRELEKTGIVKIGLEDFKIKAAASVSGYPLNQFALDEYKNNLRIATTIGERGIFWRWGIGGVGGAESVSDVYILGDDLKIQGSVKDLGKTERIYSVRFLKDKGYVVTFRQIDPFYVLDLSEPKNPQLKGELKIPGYSSYLHPINKDKILGVGKENWQVKISLFDVLDPTNPKEAAKYNLNESYSEIESTHHAFLMDKKHEIFFLPGSKGGYVFSYKNDKLELQRAVSDIQAKRAIYINDYLYIIGEDKIIVLNELDWKKVNELKLD